MRTPWQPVPPQPLSRPGGPAPLDGSRRGSFPDTAVGPDAARDGLGLTLSHARPGELRLHVSGEVDLLTAPELVGALREAVHAAGAARSEGRRPRVTCDLDDVGFFGATGLRALVLADADAVDQDVDLEIAASHGAAHRCLRLTALDRSLTVTDRVSRPPAVFGLGTPPP